MERLDGNVSRSDRQDKYRQSRIFFMTPQTLENDINNHLLDPAKTCLLIVDEAHRTTGEYSYNKVISLIEETNAGFRIVALSATPVSKIDNLQSVMNNLRVSNFEVRSEEDQEI